MYCTADRDRFDTAHRDRPLAACNALTKREAQVLVKRKFPPKQSECWEERARGTRNRAHLRRGGVMVMVMVKNSAYTGPLPHYL